jgi:opacity protein-like surface antigen
VVLALAAAPDSRAEWSLGAYVGAAHTISTDVPLTQPERDTEVTFAAVTFRGDSFTPPLYYGFRAGRFFGSRPWLGIEAEFIHLKLYARTGETVTASGQLHGVPLDGALRLDTVVQHLSISHGLNLLLANVVARVPLAGNGYRGTVATVRAGVGPTIPHAESRVLGVAAPERYELGAAGLQLAAGVEQRVAGRVWLLAEYKFTRSDQTVAVAEGQAEVLARSHHVVVGLGWR